MRGGRKEEAAQRGIQGASGDGGLSGEKTLAERCRRGYAGSLGRGAVGDPPGRSPRWVLRHLPRAAPPDSWRSQRGRAGPFNKDTACHNRAPSRQSSGTKHIGEARCAQDGNKNLYRDNLASKAIGDLAGAARSEVSRGFFEAIVDAFDFSRFRCIVEVGGGQGQLLGSILARHPGSKGILYDVPEIVAGALAVLRAHGVADRCEAVGGDMLRSVPRAAMHTY